MHRDRLCLLHKRGSARLDILSHRSNCYAETASPLRTNVLACRLEMCFQDVPSVAKKKHSMSAFELISNLII